MFPSLSRFRPNWTHPLPTHDGALKIDPKGCVTTPCVTIRREHLFTRRAIRQKAHHHPPAAAKSEEYESHPDSQWRSCWWDGKFSILQYKSSVQMPFYFHLCAQCTPRPKDRYWKKYISKFSIIGGRYKSCWPKQEKCWRLFELVDLYWVVCEPVIWCKVIW